MTKFDLSNSFTSYLNNDACIQELPLDVLIPFVDNNGCVQPFRSRPDLLPELVESIKRVGVLSPVVVRAKGDDGEYEILSGHRRVEASRIAGLSRVPVVIQEVDDNEAAIVLVDSNLNSREYLLESEKAFAYKLKLEAMKKQGKRSDLTSCQVGTKLNGERSNEQLASESNESARQIMRYIRLTELIPEHLDLVDRHILKFIPAVALSYLTKDEQQMLWNIMESNHVVPSLVQSTQIRQLSTINKLDEITLERILAGKKQKKPQFILKSDKLSYYFEDSTSQEDIEKVIIELLDNWFASKESM
jgi:ParB family transcriptional regulator, chromosome partitioning protein